ncbi:nitrogen assimilation transcriptional regulator NAC [Limnohabitans sp. 2KL-1]|uniref:nitrogen assimilation transcriptional regulator NAC n=1 Tax=Limnohabitans sp. 2KL-1 TaxID=1100699 RepID=UPI0018EEA881|nr:nitrogen assimilation transcriptional regulator NAC [Limnohabitans sp. 2KL-1]
MNLRRLKYFVKIVDVGSLTQAADLLHIAQPAISQQLATLEAEVHQQLLLRTKRGVTPTEAGKVLYRHAQLILRQCDQAVVDMQTASSGISGSVCIGLAPGTMAATLALPLLRILRARHPGIVPYLNENYGTTLSELVMSGRMDLAVLYGGRDAIHGLQFLPLLRESLYLVGPPSMQAPAEIITVRELAEFDLYLPRSYNYLRRLVDEAFASLGLKPRVVAEIESAKTLSALISDGLGAAVVPTSLARELVVDCNAWQARIIEPEIEARLALCQSDHLPLSEPAKVVKDILLEVIADIPGSFLSPASRAQPIGGQPPI